MKNDHWKNDFSEADTIQTKIWSAGHFRTITFTNISLTDVSTDGTSNIGGVVGINNGSMTGISFQGTVTCAITNAVGITGPCSLIAGTNNASKTITSTTITSSTLNNNGFDLGI